MYEGIFFRTLKLNGRGDFGKKRRKSWEEDSYKKIIVGEWKKINGDTDWLSIWMDSIKQLYK